MAEGSRYRINTPSVVHEAIEGEVVVINFDTGTYYSLEAVAARIWHDLECGSATDEIAADVAADFACGNSDVAADIAEFVGGLKRENLIAPVVDSAPAASPMTERLAASGAPASRLAYAPPVLHTYTDMQALLLLDPIHEVDETGWPRVRAGGEP